MLIRFMVLGRSCALRLARSPSSRMAQNHTNPRAACQPERTGTAQHHKPNVTRAALKTRKPRARSWLIRLLTKRAGANTSNNLVTYSSIECAACARIRDRKTKWPLCFTTKSWASTVLIVKSTVVTAIRTNHILAQLLQQSQHYVICHWSYDLLSC